MRETRRTLEALSACDGSVQIFQAKKADWLPLLPRKTHDGSATSQMSEDQQRQYNQMEKQFLLEMAEGIITVEVAIAKYAKLAQIQAGFIYDEDRIVHELVKPEDNPRLSTSCGFWILGGGRGQMVVSSTVIGRSCTHSDQSSGRV